MELVTHLRSSHLGNERAIWIREPRDSTTSHNLVIFLDAERYRDRVGATSVIVEGRAAGITDSGVPRPCGRPPSEGDYCRCDLMPRF
jgi:hypothetical protein